jgi:hypothetical protein
MATILLQDAFTLYFRSKALDKKISLLAAVLLFLLEQAVYE